MIEVTLGLAILVLIFGVIFQLVQMSVLGADAAGKNSLRCREISGLFALVRQICLDLPVRSQLRIEPREGGGGYDLVLNNAPLAILPEAQGGNRTLRLALQKDPAGGGGVLPAFTGGIPRPACGSPAGALGFSAAATAGPGSLGTR